MDEETEKELRRLGVRIVKGIESGFQPENETDVIATELLAKV